MKLCIDPGHGLANRTTGVYDSGAVGGSITEAQIAIEWAQTLKYLCNEAGVETWLTRVGADDPAPLGKRVARAQAQSCTRLISLHCNAYNGSARGTETLYRSGSESGKTWAGIVQGAAMAGLAELDTEWPSRGIKPDSESQHSRLAILGGGFPSCLLEIGFIDNEDDRRQLTQRAARIAVCSRIVAALEEMI